MYLNYNFSGYFHIEAIVDPIFLLEILFPFKIILMLLLKDMRKSVMNSSPGICIQLAPCLSEFESNSYFFSTI